MRGQATKGDIDQAIATAMKDSVIIRATPDSCFAGKIHDPKSDAQQAEVSYRRFESQLAASGLHQSTLSGHAPDRRQPRCSRYLSQTAAVCRILLFRRHSGVDRLSERRVSAIGLFRKFAPRYKVRAPDDPTFITTSGVREERPDGPCPSAVRAAIKLNPNVNDVKRQLAQLKSSL